MRRTLSYDGVEIVHDRMREVERARRMAARKRNERIESLVIILHRLVLIASALMIVAGACVVDGASTINTEVSGWLLMGGGVSVLALTGLLFGGDE